MTSRALVTGGGGFIGSHLVDRLLDEGYEVRVLDNFSTGRRENLAHALAEVDLVEGDIQSYERCSTAVRGCELVFHQAALPSVPRSIADPLTSSAVNVTGTLNVLLAARDAGVRRVIAASSSSVYGANPALPKREEMAALPISPYAVAKQAAESYCRAFTAVYGLETVALRYFNVFGPRQDPESEYSAVIPRFIRCALSERRPTIFGDGEQSRDFTFIDNVIEANILASRTAATEVLGSHVNVACGARVSLNRMLAELEQLTGEPLQAHYADPRPGDVKHSVASIELARRTLGFEPAVEFNAGLRATLNSHREVLAADG